MKLSAITVGMRVKHPHYGIGIVKSISTATADIEFSDGMRTISPEVSGLEPEEAVAIAAITGLEVPLSRIIEQTVRRTLAETGFERPDEVIAELGMRWRGGTFVIQPEDASLQSKAIPLETFFHKVVMIRNNLRVLEQKINAHTGLPESEKVDLQQYITKCYGSLTSFNLLFKEKESGC